MMPLFYNAVKRIVSCALLPYLFGANALADKLDDIDGDGKPETITQTKFEDSNRAAAKFRIKFSANAPDAYFVVPEDELYFSYYPSRQEIGTLALEYTNRSSRQTPDFYYEVYNFIRSYNKLYLLSAAAGIPPDQLAGETFDSERFVRLFADCVGLGETRPDIDIEDKDYYQKSDASVFITAEKAPLYNSPDDKAKSKMYLIAGDKVKIKEYKYAQGYDWFLAEYQPAGKKEPIIKWARQESLYPKLR